MRKGPEWGYIRYDMRFDPLFKMKVSMTEKLPGWPIAGLSWEKLEKVQPGLFLFILDVDDFL
jgi:NADH dehydrogenase (ubiquinone) 1 alpha subcomplex subunit 9